MAIHVEFYGIARQRAGAFALDLEMSQATVPLGDVLHQLAARLPDLGREFLVEGRLHQSLTANIDGSQFVTDPATILRDGQSLLILSADAGG